MSKFVSNQMEQARKTVEEIKAALAAGPINLETYNKMRTELNQIVIQAVVGGKIVAKKDGIFKKNEDNEVIYTIKYSEKLPTRNELAAICKLMDEVVNDIEARIIESFDDTLDQDVDDMDIPDPIGSAFNDEAVIEEIDKINAKKLTNLLMGDDEESIRSQWITSTNIMQIAANAETLRKKRNRNRAFVIAGITLVAVGAGAGYVTYKRKDSNDIIDVDDCDCTDIDINDIDTPDIEDINIEDDAPVVTLDE